MTTNLYCFILFQAQGPQGFGYETLIMFGLIIAIFYFLILRPQQKKQKETDDDKSLPTVKHSVRLYSAWKEANKSAELHIYSSGGHGFSMRKLGKPVDTWTDRFRDWLALQGLLKK